MFRLITRGFAQKRSIMEDYFIKKSFIVTGAGAGKYLNI